MPSEYLLKFTVDLKIIVGLCYYLSLALFRGGAYYVVDSDPQAIFQNMHKSLSTGRGYELIRCFVDLATFVLSQNPHLTPHDEVQVCVPVYTTLLR